MPRPRRKAQTVRLNLDVTPAMRDRLERLTLSTDARSRVEVIAWALAAYEKLVDAVADGSDVVIRKGAKEATLLLSPA